MVWLVGMADNDGTQSQNNKKKKRKRQANPDETGIVCFKLFTDKIDSG